MKSAGDTNFGGIANATEVLLSQKGMILSFQIQHGKYKYLGTK